MWQSILRREDVDRDTIFYVTNTTTVLPGRADPFKSQDAFDPDPKYRNVYTIMTVYCKTPSRTHFSQLISIGNYVDNKHTLLGETQCPDQRITVLFCKRGWHDGSVDDCSMPCLVCTILGILVNTRRKMGQSCDSDEIMIRAGDTR